MRCSIGSYITEDRFLEEWIKFTMGEYWIALPESDGSLIHRQDFLIFPAPGEGRSIMGIPFSLEAGFIAVVDAGYTRQRQQKMHRQAQQHIAVELGPDSARVMSTQGV